MRRLAVVPIAVAMLLFSSGPAAADRTPTCSDVLDVAVHGQHIVGDYVTGIGRANLDWPPSGGVVGETVAGEGVAIRGGPGPGFHFPNGFAAGASFCLGQSHSPGFHASGH